MEKAKQLALLIKLFQRYPSGYIPYDVSTNSLGISKKVYSRIFNSLITLKLLRKGTKGYFINRFKFGLFTIYGYNFHALKITDKQCNFMQLTKNILQALAHLKISQQFYSATTTILEKKGRGVKYRYLLMAHLKEGVVAQVRISARQMGKWLGCSHVLANDIINSLKRLKRIKIKRDPLKLKKYHRYLYFRQHGAWACERYVIDTVKCFSDELIYKPKSLLCK